MLHKGDYCGNQAQLAATFQARGDSSQKLFCPRAASRSQRHPERCEREQSDGEQGLPEPLAGLHFVAFVILMLKNVAEAPA
jgi:hypothetical protein